MKNYKSNISWRLGFILLILFAMILYSCNTKNEIKQTSVPQMDFEEFEPLLNKNNDTLYIINFWATWCKPCVKEMPYFQRIEKEYRTQAVKVILVSLDFPNKHEELLLPFLEQNAIESKVIHLTDMKAYQWIDKVNPQWSGAIPATVFYKGDSFREFIEGSLTYDDLKQIIDNNL
jgi:thiol-disulfide isomerase/thioredoxin